MPISKLMVNGINVKNINSFNIYALIIELMALTPRCETTSGRAV